MNNALKERAKDTKNPLHATKFPEIGYGFFPIKSK